MTQNKRIVETFMDGFRRTDRALILSTLSDDVEWDIPGAFHVRGKDEFARHIVDDGFVSCPAIHVTLFEMQGGKIRRLISYLVELPKPAD